MVMAPSPAQQYLEDFCNKAYLSTWTTPPDGLEKMEALYNKLDPSSQDAVALCFALAKIHADLNNIEHSFQLLVKGNRHHYQNKTDTIEDARLTYDLVKKVFATQRPTPITAPSHYQAIFIVGMPRSGTSLVEQILASHSAVYGAGELGLMGQWCFGYLKMFKQYGRALNIDQYLPQLRDHYLKGTGQLTQKTVVTDKMPLNFFWLGFILSVFPNATIIHTVRDPMATCWSNFKTPFAGRSNGYTCDLGHIGEFYTLYRSLMAYWEQMFPEKIYSLNYESLTENQLDETKKLLAHCNLDWEDACLQFHKNKREVLTASKHQVRMPIYKGSSEAWKKFEEYLGPLQSRLQDPPG